MSNILPKKSWNVYNEKNKEKVRKDELEVQIQAEKKAERAEEAERESRLNILRQRANVQWDNSIETSEDKSQKIEKFSLFEETKPGEKDSQKIQSKSRHITIQEQHALADPMAKALLKNNSDNLIKFDQKRNSSSSKQIINKSCPEARKKLREERERTREEELLKKRRIR